MLLCLILAAGCWLEFLSKDGGNLLLIYTWPGNMSL